MRQSRPHQVRRRGCCVAVAAAGFEPAEGCPSRAFEARSFGRSDTPPRRRITEGDASDEIRSTRMATSAAAGQRPKKARRAAPHSASRMPPRTSTRWLSRGSRTTSNSEDDRARLGIVGAEHEPVDPRQHQGTGAHRAGLEGDHQGAPVEPPVAPPLGGPPQRQHLRVARSGRRSAPARCRRRPPQHPRSPARRPRPGRPDDRPVRRRSLLGQGEAHGLVPATTHGVRTGPRG